MKITVKKLRKTFPRPLPVEVEKVHPRQRACYDDERILLPQVAREPEWDADHEENSGYRHHPLLRDLRLVGTRRRNVDTDVIYLILYNLISR